MKTTITALAAGIVIFIWGFVSWTVLPWHNAGVHKFSDEQVVIQNLVNQSSSSGIYYIPGDQADYSKDTPAAFVNVLKDGYGTGMGGMMAKAIIFNILIASLVIFLLQKTNGLSYIGRLGFVTLTGLIIGLGASFPYWNWFGFPGIYSLVLLLDSVVTWFLAGLVIAKFTPYK